MTINKNNKPIIIWLFSLMIMLFSLVLVGGATRVTDSGLSITEWNLVFGILPPLSMDSWLLEFEKYKKIPEYILINYQMSLSEFKVIYLWEWGHRFLARLVGLVALVPFIYFLITKNLSKSQILKSTSVIVLIGFQGYIGWYMVQSGLTERVDVSQYRLAIHLLMAFIIIYMSWLLLFNVLDLKGPKIMTSYKIWTTFFISLIFIQIFIGGFVSGLDAGLIYPTWPLMGESIVPLDYWKNDLKLLNLFENRSNIQFNHRFFGYLIFLFSIFNLFLFRNIADLFKLSLIIFILIFLQISLGILSILLYMPWQIALSHQFFALILFSFASLLGYLSFNSK